MSILYSVNLNVTIYCIFYFFDNRKCNFYVFSFLSELILIPIYIHTRLFTFILIHDYSSKNIHVSFIVDSHKHVLAVVRLLVRVGLCVELVFKRLLVLYFQCISVLYFNYYALYHAFSSHSLSSNVCVIIPW